MAIAKQELEEIINGLDTDASSIQKNINGYFIHMSANPAKNELGHRAYKWPTPDTEPKESQRKARREFEVWYAKAVELISEYRPRRKKEFESKADELRDVLSISDTTTSITPEQARNKATDLLDDLRGMVRGVLGKIEIQEIKARKQISARISRDEIQQSRDLLENDFVRAAGVVAAVAVERHLLTMCENEEAVTEYEPNHGISRLAQTLKEADVIDKTRWNDLRALASIRETCAHPEEPNREAVRRLINDGEEFIRDITV